MKHWSRNDKFAFFGVILGVLGVIAAVFPQELRHMAGFDGGAASAQSSTVTAPAQSAPPAPPPPPDAVEDLKISVTGDENTVTILAAKTKEEETVGPVSVLGDKQENTYYLGKGQHAVLSLIGDGNTLRLAPDVKSRVQTSTMGDGTKTSVAGEE